MSRKPILSVMDSSVTMNHFYTVLINHFSSLIDIRKHEKTEKRHRRDSYLKIYEGGFLCAPQRLRSVLIILMGPEFPASPISFSFLVEVELAGGLEFGFIIKAFTDVFKTFNTTKMRSTTNEPDSIKDEAVQRIAFSYFVYSNSQK